MKSESGSNLDKAAGIVKQSATGLRKGIADIAGLPGDAAEAIGKGADWLADKAGLPPVSEAAGKVLPKAIAHAVPGPAGAIYDAYQAAGDRIPDRTREVINPLRGSDVANRTMQEATGPYRVPENVGEEFADTGGRFTAASLAGGPAGAGRNVVVRLLRCSVGALWRARKSAESNASSS